jgi:hypothetical protein
MKRTSACPFRCQRSTTRSIRVPREPLTSTRSPGPTIDDTAAAADDASANRRVRLSASPAATAPETRPSAAGPPTATSRSTPARAACRPQVSWSVRRTAEFEHLAENGDTRPSACVTESAWSMADVAAGLALYESSMTRARPARRISAPRRATARAAPRAPTDRRAPRRIPSRRPPPPTHSSDGRGLADAPRA